MIPYTQPPPYHSQWGEDRWLAEHLDLPNRGVFVDIGAGDGTRGSNTLYFERRGWTGVCADPDPRNQAPLRRRRCIVDHRAISSTPGARQLGMYESKSSWSGLERRGPGYTSITVECVRLDTLLAETGITSIDLLSIDVEGTELDVWRSFDPDRHQPGIVIIEYDDRHPARTTAAIQHALGSSYTLRRRTPANLIFQRNTQ